VRGDSERLRDIAEAIVRIRKYAARGRHAFEADELIDLPSLERRILEILSSEFPSE